jgi:Pyridoxamine 5'-phosphate oxidase
MVTGGVCSGIVAEILQATEFVTIATNGENGPYLAGCWGNYLRYLPPDGDTILIPAGRYWQTEKNLSRNANVVLMAASRQVQSVRGGQGCILRGHAEILTAGSYAEIVKAKFPWARGALLIHVKEARIQR